MAYDPSSVNRFIEEAAQRAAQEEQMTLREQALQDEAAARRLSAGTEIAGLLHGFYGWVRRHDIPTDSSDTFVVGIFFERCKDLPTWKIYDGRTYSPPSGDERNGTWYGNELRMRADGLAINYHNYHRTLGRIEKIVPHILQWPSKPEAPLTLIQKGIAAIAQRNNIPFD